MPKEVFWLCCLMSQSFYTPAPTPPPPPHTHTNSCNCTIIHFFQTSNIPHTSLSIPINPVTILQPKKFYGTHKRELHYLQASIWFILLFFSFFFLFLSKVTFHTKRIPSVVCRKIIFEYQLQFCEEKTKYLYQLKVGVLGICFVFKADISLSDNNCRFYVWKYFWVLF